MMKRIVIPVGNGNPVQGCKCLNLNRHPRINWISGEDNKFQHGFTLISLLILIAIIAVLSTFGLIFTEKETENLKVKKAALQIKQILQGGIAYLDKNNSWPSAGTQDFLKSYVGGGITESSNPWGGNYTWGKDPSSSSRFQVTANNIPDNDINPLIAVFPDATKSGNSVSVVVSSKKISEPFIVAAGETDCDKVCSGCEEAKACGVGREVSGGNYVCINKINYTCPSGTEFKGIAFLENFGAILLNFDTGKNKGGYNPFRLDISANFNSKNNLVCIVGLPGFNTIQDADSRIIVKPKVGYLIICNPKK